MEYETIHNSIREQNYRTGVVKRTAKPEQYSNTLSNVLYTSLSFIALITFPMLYTAL